MLKNLMRRLTRKHLGYGSCRKCCVSAELRQGKHVGSADVRKRFVDYFVERHDHLYVGSCPVNITSDPNLLYVNAGMNQFKPIILGTVSPDSPMARYRRVVNSQKCVRVSGKHNDLDAVGRDGSHHTFFEMLGSWSFGDYSKKEACAMAWDLLVNVYGLPENRLYVTYFSGDERSGLQPDLECREAWLQLGLRPERILPFGMKDNFWSMGPVGPCGPCTEIHYVHALRDDAHRLVNADDPGLVEVWNLVFMQYERENDGTLRKLPVQHVDTGMGLERLCAILSGSQSNYDTDLFQPIFEAIHKHGTVDPYRGTFGTDDSRRVDDVYRMVADHARMFSVSIADGVVPSDVGPGGPLRRIIRRAAWHSRNRLGCRSGTLGKLTESVIASLGPAYPELQVQAQKVKEIVNNEEQMFYSVIDKNYSLLLSELTNLEAKNSDRFTGDMLFKFCSSNGFPFELLIDLITERGFKSDIPEYNRLLEEEKVKSRTEYFNKLKREQSITVDQESIARLNSKNVKLTDDGPKYQYTKGEHGYAFPSLSATLLSAWSKGALVDALNEGEEGALVFDKTNFYHQAGGQMSDVGVIVQNESKFLVEKVNAAMGYVFHHGKVVKGAMKTSEDATLAIDEENRLGCMRSHSGCHLLVASLEQMLGETVEPRWSKCEPDSLKLDITLKRPMKSKDLKRIVAFILDAIDGGVKVDVKMISKEEVFHESSVIRTIKGKDYPDPMRVVMIINHEFASVEACCGTHVLDCGDIKKFVIVSHNSHGQNVKQIKAVTGPRAEEVLAYGRTQNDLFRQLQARFDELIVSTDETPSKVDLKEINKKLGQIRKRMAENTISAITQFRLDRNVGELKHKISKILEDKGRALEPAVKIKETIVE